VDLLGDQLLAGAGLALDQDGRAGRGDILEQREHLPHLGVATDHGAEGDVFGRRLRLDDLFVGQELDDRAAELDLGAEADGDLLEPRVAWMKVPLVDPLVDHDDLVAHQLAPRGACATPSCR
jgi:hypothetical protein